MATTTTTVTFDDLMKELKAIRKDLRKIKAHIEDPTGEKKVSRFEGDIDLRGPDEADLEATTEETATEEQK